MEKIAIISDIHGNLEALKTTLADIKSRNINRIFCLGDIVHKGVHVNECLRLIRENCSIVLRGNTDEYFTKKHDLNILSEQERIRIEWNQKVLTKEDKNYLTQLPFSYEFYLSGNLIRLFHASPQSIYSYVGIFANIEDWYKMFLPTENTLSNLNADIVVYGHLHTPFMNSRYNKTLINCGSIGNNLDYIRNEDKDSSYSETTKASYLILEGEYNSKDHNNSISYQLVKVPYDIEKELSSNIYNPEKQAYQYELRYGRYRDLSKTYDNFKKDGVDITKI